ncbi:MAG: hypothetical protein ACOC3D_10475 [Pseudomonadota bacterium]
MPECRRRVAVPLLVGWLAGCASGPGGSPGAGFAAIDRDGNRVVTQEELIASFAVVDRNGDGVIDVEESAAVVYEADANRNGVVTPGEFAMVAISRLEADGNRDGRITRAEFEEHDRRILAELRASGGASASPGELRPEVRWLTFRF